MMLPLPRKWRFHREGNQPRCPLAQDPQLLGPVQSCNMTEPALAAWVRLEEKLHFSTRPSTSSSRWSQFMHDGSNTFIPQNTTPTTTTTTTNTATTSQSVSLAEATTRPTLPNSAFWKRLASRSHELCAICLEEVKGEKKVVQLPCSHKYHSDCVLPWLASHPDCPCCRTTVPPIATLS